MPKVSVIIPTYNRRKLLGSAVKSVLNQTFEDFEVLIIDNGSTDNTRAVVSEFGDQRINYLRLEVNKGVSPARNVGIAHSNCKYIAFLDDDDTWSSRKLERQVSLLENSPSMVAAVYTGYIVIDRTTGLLLGKVVPNSNGDLFDQLCKRNCIGTSTVILKSECLKSVGVFDNEIPYAEEYDLWIRLAKKFHFKCIEEPLVEYSYHLSNASSNWEQVIKGLEAIDKKHGHLFARYNCSYSQFNLALGELYCYVGNQKKGREALLKATRLNPLQIRSYFYLSLSLLGTRRFRSLTDALQKTTLSLRARRRLPAV